MFLQNLIHDAISLINHLKFLPKGTSDTLLVCGAQQIEGKTWGKTVDLLVGKLPFSTL